MAMNMRAYMLTERVQMVLLFSLFFSWVLAFPFEGQILRHLSQYMPVEPNVVIFGAIGVHFIGLLVAGMWTKTIFAVRNLILFSIAAAGLTTVAFFLPYYWLWLALIMVSAFLSGACIAAWGFFFKAFSKTDERLKTAADVLIGANVFMIVMNMAITYGSLNLCLIIALILLSLAFMITLYLPMPAALVKEKAVCDKKKAGIAPVLGFLCMFIVIMTFNSGLMYSVVNPAFEHLDWLVGWYWAIPYIVTILIIRNLPPQFTRNYALYVGISMMGLSFVAFMALDRSAISYLIIDTLLLAACGIYDLFWWTILGEMMDHSDNPAGVIGSGLAANVFGILIGGIVGRALDANGTSASLRALGIVCLVLVILPPLKQRLGTILELQAYFTMFMDMSHARQVAAVADAADFTEREQEITILILQGKRNKEIAEELYISENTVKTHVKKIYSKLAVNNRRELIELILREINN